MQTFFTALADRTRRRILNLIREQEICVCYCTEVLEVSQPKISRHLAYLRNAEIVAARRDGKWMYYRIIEPKDFYSNQILRKTLEWLQSQERMQKDFDKLATVCSTPKMPIILSRSSKANILRETDIFARQKEQLETFLL